MKFELQGLRPDAHTHTEPRARQRLGIKHMFTLLDLRVSSLRRGRADLLHIVRLFSRGSRPEGNTNQGRAARDMHRGPDQPEGEDISR